MTGVSSGLLIFALARMVVYRLHTDVKEIVKKKDRDFCVQTLMFTSHPEDKSKFWQIQVCPWFLDWAVRQDKQFTSLIKTSLWSKFRGLAIPIIANIKYKPIDLVSLFDKVFLHEITHTDAGGETLDVQRDGKPDRDGYGWTNCRRISLNRQVLGVGPSPPNRNADSLALFGSASFIIQRQGGVVREDGTFSIPAPQPTTGTAAPPAVATS